MVWGMFQLPGRPNEISVYGTENYYETTPGRVRRFVYRVDGFVALRGGADAGQVTTKTLAFNGQRLLLNYVVHPGGSLIVDALDESGKQIGKSDELIADAIDGVVEWSTKPDFSSGKAQLRFHLKNADVYSLRFE